ncbi:MAG: bifunctional DNA-binding transcriptional regulator/O6-methylguanine-DNA methyltransferase Ada [Hydrocarboniphaga sp.]|uniref:methylated-DNA--[protein]-cysteine S-methyltransferase n=1 Tax=Hydrocarboniphaga sp. TaxID=2033016 RepID=UPI002604ED41|nr:methylated-DNA--[protein]-cysteine S-methyltransferase [Hydrocarboniphaga sp.]MDB5972772.1 bifunctional DNA-binding transcriptional regulator/O6-methylguanine-DNA methyltransferase Ada [Hydrocarboniphaga sp.]
MNDSESTTAPLSIELRARIEALCRHIDANPEQTLSLAALAARARLSRFHLQRSFKAFTGVTPRQYADAARLRRLKAGLRSAESVTGAIVDAGYGSASRVYERVATHLGMTPGEYRAGGKGMGISYAMEESVLGWLLMAATDRGLCFVQFGDSADELIARLKAEYPKADVTPMSEPARPQFEAWMAALATQLRGARTTAGLPLDLRGTAFQMKVWAYLLKIPSGELRSYTEVAAAIGHPKAVRAVASACAANRVGVLVPCHRVIRGDGGMGGYRWGLERKRALIDAERGAG